MKPTAALIGRCAPISPVAGAGASVPAADMPVRIEVGVDRWSTTGLLCVATVSGSRFG
jgi:hypothetical protein